MRNEETILEVENASRIRLAVDKKFDELFPNSGTIPMCRKEPSGLFFTITRNYESVLSVFIMYGSIAYIEWNGDLIHVARFYDDGVCVEINNSGISVDMTLLNGTTGRVFFPKNAR